MQQLRIHDLKSLINKVEVAKSVKEEVTAIFYIEERNDTVVVYNNEIIDIDLIGNNLLVTAPEIVHKQGKLELIGDHRNFFKPVLVLGVGNGEFFKDNDIKVGDKVRLDINLIQHAKPYTFDNTKGVSLSRDIIDRQMGVRDNVSLAPYPIRVVPTHMLIGNVKELFSKEVE